MTIVFIFKAEVFVRKKVYCRIIIQSGPERVFLFHGKKMLRNCRMDKTYFAKLPLFENSALYFY